MRKQIHVIWLLFRQNLWFVPGLMVVLATVLALVTVRIDQRIDAGLLNYFPSLGIRDDGARDVLGAIAGSMITVAGVVFSITIVALTLAANTYSPRVLSTFMSDRSNQFVMGYFTAVFTYTLLVLRTVRTGEDSFVPLLAVMIGIVLAVCSTGVLIYFVHHVAHSLHAANVVARTAQLTLEALVSVVGATSTGDSKEKGPGVNDIDWHPIPAESTGYIQSIRHQTMLSTAAENKIVIRMDHSVGGFVIRGTPLAWADLEPPERLQKSVHDAVIVGSNRTIEQDPLFGLRQIVDVALKALSPAINDTTTAIMCMDHITALLLEWGRTPAPPALHYANEQLHLITKPPRFAAALDLGFHQIRQNSPGNVVMTIHLLDCLRRLYGALPEEGQRNELIQHAGWIGESAEEAIVAEHDLQLVRERLARLKELSSRAHVSQS